MYVCLCVHLHVCVQCVEEYRVVFVNTDTRHETSMAPRPVRWISIANTVEEDAVLASETEVWRIVNDSDMRFNAPSNPLDFLAPVTAGGPHYVSYAPVTATAPSDRAPLLAADHFPLLVPEPPPYHDSDGRQAYH